MQGNNSVNIGSSKRMVYRAVDQIKKQPRGDIEATFVLVPGLLKKFQELNPGSTTAFEQDERSRFSRAFLQPRTSARALPFALRIVGLDGAHSKGPTYNGTQLILVGRDGNSENLALAIALVDKETIDNYKWFFAQCVKGGIKFDYPLMSDRNPSLLNVCARRGISHRFCTLHIVRNLMSGFSAFTANQKALVWRVQASTSMQEYEAHLTTMQMECGDPVADYVRGIDSTK